MTLKGRDRKVTRSQFLSLRSVCYETFLAQRAKKRLKRIAELQHQLCLNMKTKVVYYLPKLPEVLLKI